MTQEEINSKVSASSTYYYVRTDIVAVGLLVVRFGFGHGRAGQGQVLVALGELL